MEVMIEGYKRFRQNVWPSRKALFQHLAVHGQNPSTLLIMCSDSRVDPTLIFDAEPGDFFIVRNIAAFVPPPEAELKAEALAALEYGICVLNIPHVVVFGHTGCGGVQALINENVSQALNQELGEDLKSWITAMQPACQTVLHRHEHEEAYTKKQFVEECEFESIKLSLDNLLRYPWIAERVASKNLRLHGASFDIATATVSFMDAGGVFRKMREV